MCALRWVFNVRRGMAGAQFSGSRCARCVDRCGEATAMWALDDLSETLRGQRRSLERQWEDDESTTEDMRIALRRYRTFFDRLLSL
jgi:hypothetical protein